MNIAPLGGRISLPLNSPYDATKFALEGLSESIQYELESFGINHSDRVWRCWFELFVRSSTTFLM